MKKLDYVIPAIIGAALILGTYAIASGEPDAGAPVAAVADPSMGAGSGSATEMPNPDLALPGLPKPAAELADPIAAPVAAWDDWKAARKVGWPLAIFAGLLFVFRVIGRFSKSKAGTFLASGRSAVVIAGIGATATACYDAALDGGTWVAIVSAALAAALKFSSAIATPPKAAP